MMQGVAVIECRSRRNLKKEKAQRNRRRAQELKRLVMSRYTETTPSLRASALEDEESVLRVLRYLSDPGYSRNRQRC